MASSIGASGGRGAGAVARLEIVFGYVDTPDGRRTLAPYPRFSGTAFDNALGLRQFISRPTAAQRRLGGLSSR